MQNSLVPSSVNRMAAFMLCLTTSFLGFATPAEAQGVPINRLDVGTFPIGSTAGGTTSLELAMLVGSDPLDMNTYLTAVFQYVGDETLVYQVNLDESIEGFRLPEIREMWSGASVLKTAGLMYRDSAGVLFETPTEATSTLVSHQVQGKRLRLVYQDSGIVDGLPLPTVLQRVVEIEIVGKALRLRCYSGDLARLDGQHNYAGWRFGQAYIADPEDLVIPYMISTPVARFKDSGDSSKDYFISHQVDWSKSHGTRHELPGEADVSPGRWGTSEKVYYDRAIDPGEVLLPQQSPTPLDLNSAVDETVWLIVSSEIQDTFQETEASPTPYRDILASRPVTLFSGADTTWTEYTDLANDYGAWGMALAAQHFFYYWSEYQQWGFQFDPVVQTGSHFWSSARGEIIPQVPASPPVPVPTVPDINLSPAPTPDFATLMDTFRSEGILSGVYTLYRLNDGQDYHDASDSAMKPSGPVHGPYLPIMSADRAYSHINFQENILAEKYSPSLTFRDVDGYSHPEMWVDLDTNSTDEAKTIREALIANRRNFILQQEIHEGPVLSEGSIAHRTSNYELLYAGFADSTEATINTNIQKEISTLTQQEVDNLAAIGKYLPSKWWVVPDYALRVVSRTQVPHGNAFYKRFFHKANLPLSDAQVDKYRLYEITYGKSSYLTTNGKGAGDGTGNIGAGASAGNHMTYANHIKEYYLMQGLQELYLRSSIQDVSYFDIGGPLNGESLSVKLASSTSTGPVMEDFFDPRILLEYENGLKVWLNHSVSDWIVDYKGTGLAADKVTLEEDGWLAYHDALGFIAFTGIPDGVSYVIDYVFYPNRYTLFDGRRLTSSYLGMVAPTGNGLIVKNWELSLQISELLHDEIVTSVLVPPQGSQIVLDRFSLQGAGSAPIPVGNQVRLRPHGMDGQNAGGEFPYLKGEFLVLNPSTGISYIDPLTGDFFLDPVSGLPIVAPLEVNSAGVVTALSPGNADVVFTALIGAAGSQTASKNLTISKALPTISAFPESGYIAGQSILTAIVNDPEGTMDITSFTVDMTTSGGTTVNVYPGFAGFCTLSPAPHGAIKFEIPFGIDGILSSPLFNPSGLEVTFDFVVSDSAGSATLSRTYQLHPTPL